MALMFPNPSRSFDEVGKRIRFTGHDGMMEIPFFIELSALAKVRSDTVADEASWLAAFDRVRTSIQNVAKEVYSRGRQAIYVLKAADFR